jgi:hypothetical protein
MAKLTKSYTDSTECLECGNKLPQGSIFRYTNNAGFSRHGKGICLLLNDGTPQGTPGCGWNDLSDDDRLIARSKLSGAFEVSQTIEPKGENGYSTNGHSASSAPSTNGTNGGNGGNLDLLGIIAGSVAPMVASQVTTQVAEKLKGLNLLDEDRVLDLFEQAMAQYKPPADKLEVTLPNGTVNTVNGFRHAAFEPLMRLVQSRLDTLIYGDAGGGKTTLVMQVAEALGLPYYAVQLSKLATPTELKGFISASEKYVQTQFYQWFTGGGVMALEEIGAANGNLAVTLNTALDNGICSFPGMDSPAKRHPDAILIGCDNSNLSGADQLYSGRVAQDAAFRERFVFWKWEYDERLEDLIVLGHTTKPAPVYNWKPTMDPETWVRNIQALRKAMLQLKLNGRVVISPRASIKGAKLIQIGFPGHIAEEMVVWKGLDPDTRKRLHAEAKMHGYSEPAPASKWMS